MGIRDSVPLSRAENEDSMAIQEDPQGGMSVREAGRRGGERVKAKYGTEFYEEIGRKGGEATKVKYGPSFYEVIGQKGGQKPKRKAASAT
jgi:general stress protein YciG